MNNQLYANRKGLTVKDLVTLGIFSALYFVFVLIGGMPFAPNPLLTFYMPLGSALLAGPVYLLLVAKIQKRWAVTILGIIMGVVWFVTGMHWAFSVGDIIMAVVADFVAGTLQYKSVRMNIFSYIIMSLGAVGTYVVFFINPAAWAHTMLKKGTEQTYINTMTANAPKWLLVVIILGTIVVASFSGWIGSKMLKKQFDKAGITA